MIQKNLIHISDSILFMNESLQGTIKLNIVLKNLKVWLKLNPSRQKPSARDL